MRQLELGGMLSGMDAGEHGSTTITAHFEATYCSTATMGAVRLIQLAEKGDGYTAACGLPFNELLVGWVYAALDCRLTASRRRRFPESPFYWELRSQ